MAETPKRKTRNFADVIRAKLAQNPALAAEVLEAAIEMHAEDIIEIERAAEQRGREEGAMELASRMVAGIEGCVMTEPSQFGPLHRIGWNDCQRLCLSTVQGIAASVTPPAKESPDAD